MGGLRFLEPSEGEGVSAEDSTLVDLVHTALKRDGGSDWEVRVEGLWCAARPPAYRTRDQGWKLHVSATRCSATDVLEQSLDVLIRHRCAFKVASTLRCAALLCSTRYPRGSAGKFLTAYPDDDEHFRLLACELDRATAGLTGPTILSDRPYRASSLVHYRYGGFADRKALTNDGVYKRVLRAPDGTLLEDRQDAWFTPPAGVSLPFGEDPLPAGSAANGKAAGPRPVLLADRFVVREAIRHANRGGVFRAVDVRTDADVVIKQARPHIAANLSGSDIRDVLRHEARVLDVLGPLGIAPRKIELFEQGGHLFLAEELVPGIPLHRWVAEQAGGGPGVAWPLAAAAIRGLARLLAVAHGAGFALRDFSPFNVLVVPGGELWLIDLELAAPLGSKALPAGNPGYAAPEQLAGAQPSVQADLYSLGAISFLLATANDPRFCEDEPALRPARMRLEQWLAMTADHSESAGRLAPMILGLMDEAPERRWGLERVQAFLNAQTQVVAGYPREPGGPRRSALEQDRLIADGLEQLLAWMAPEKDRLWPTTCAGAETDPCNVAHGAAGVVAVLARLAQACPDGRTHEALDTACGWIEQQMITEPRVLPGLYFGRSGIAWALYDAARVLQDERLAERAIALAKRVPVVWPNPDLTHGAAGAGLTQLHFWQATGDAEFCRRLQRCADGLTAAAERGQTVWPIPASFDSRLAGSAPYGFAHGAAGVGWFLLAAGLAADRDDWVALALRAGDTLCEVAERHKDRATWPKGMAHWSHGSSGVGSFLIRLWQASCEERYRELAELAAVTVRRARWQAPCGFWDGLAGDAEFLLDLAGALGRPRYQDWAEELATVIAARAAYRQGRIIPPDDSGTSVAADYAVGLAGVLAFLLRLRDGGPRLWMAEPARLPGLALPSTIAPARWDARVAKGTAL